MGLFIVFEGIEGCGKTTQIDLFSNYLKQHHVPVTVTREPGGTPIGEEIRRLFLKTDHRGMLPITELALITAARAQHLADIIEPALSAERVVVCDRFYCATLAYQGYAGGLDCELIQKTHELFCKGIQPDVTVLLDCPTAVGLSRSRARNKADGTHAIEGRFEDKEFSFHERVRQGYLTIAGEFPQRFIVIDATQSIDAVHRSICTALTPKLRESGYAV